MDEIDALDIVGNRIENIKPDIVVPRSQKVTRNPLVSLYPLALLVVYKIRLFYLSSKSKIILIFILLLGTKYVKNSLACIYATEIRLWIVLAYPTGVLVK